MNISLIIFPFSVFAIPFSDYKNIVPDNSGSPYFLQSIKISGHVTDESGESLAGVSIKEKGTGNGTTTNAEGDFELNVSSEKSILEISFIGFANMEMEVGAMTTFRIILQRNTDALDSVVVIGY